MRNVIEYQQIKQVIDPGEIAAKKVLGTMMNGKFTHRDGL